jgi:signal transduction histidine kinase
MFQRATVAVAGLIAIVAALQYRWISQVSEAERDRQREHVRSAVTRFAQEFNGEITRAFFALQVGRPEGAGRDVEEAAGRTAGWLAATPYRRIVSSFYRTRGGDDGLAELLRFNPDTEKFEPVAWPARLAELRARLEVKAKAGFRGTPDMTASVDEDIPALIGARPAAPPFPPPPDPIPVGGWSIAELDLEYIGKELFPELARKHFGSEYEVRVVSRTDPGRVVLGGPDPGNSDATAGLLEIRPEPGAGAPAFPGPGGLARGGPPRAPRGLFLRPEIVDRVRGSLPAVANDVEQPVVEGASQPPAVIAAAPIANGYSIEAAQQDRSRWRLLVRHRAGSLDAAVASLRRRDLAVSAVLFLLLAASMALVVLSTRRAQRLAHQQMEFVAGVSHELRTPLTVISSAADNLADGVVAGEPQVRRYGSVIRQESRRLTDMVEQLLRFSGLQSGHAKYKLQPVQVETAFDRALAACQPELRESGMEVQKEIQPGLSSVQADPAALVHCLGNLVANALKHAREGGWIGLSARMADLGEPAVVLVVEDRGPGIDPADMPHLWEPFYRGRLAVSNQIKGAGLGLSLVKRMTEAQGGTVSVISRAGEGAVFVLRLPAARQPA